MRQNCVPAMPAAVFCPRPEKRPFKSAVFPGRFQGGGGRARSKT